MERTVETFATHPPVVHYRGAAPKDLQGDRLHAELLAAGLPDYEAALEIPEDVKKRLDELGLADTSVVPRTQVTVYPNPDGDLLDIAVPYDIDEDRSKLIAKVIKAHKGQQHPDEIALRDFTDALDQFAQRILKGEKVDPADVAFFIAATHR